MYLFSGTSWLQRSLGIIALLVPLSICVPTARSATAADIKKLIDDLSAALPQDGGQADPLWSAQAEKLRALLSKMKPADEVAAAATRAGELETLLKTKTVSGSTNPGLLDAIDKLNAAAAAVEANEPAMAFGKRVTRLLAIIPAAQLSQPDVDTTSKLIDTLGTIEIAYPIKALVQRANRATQAIKDQIPAASSPAAADGTVQSALRGLAAEIARALGLVQPRIHIIGASYGASRSRTCNATAALLTTCERKPNCALPTPATNLCGYDPAPTAADANKAAYIEYQCVTGGDDTWVKLYSRDSVVAAGVPVRHAWLHATSQSLVCMQPAP